MSEKTFTIKNGDVSDGYHTFTELYDHRCLLFLNLCMNDSKNACWRPDFPGYFILYWESPSGQISYHIPNKFLVLVENKIKREDDDHRWDGHKDEDVLFRLQNNVVIAKS